MGKTITAPYVSRVGISGRGNIQLHTFDSDVFFPVCGAGSYRMALGKWCAHFYETLIYLVLKVVTPIYTGDCQTRCFVEHTHALRKGFPPYRIGSYGKQ